MLFLLQEEAAVLDETAGEDHNQMRRLEEQRSFVNHRGEKSFSEMLKWSKSSPSTSFPL